MNTSTKNAFSQDKIVIQHTGIARILNAFFNTFKGFTWLIKNEEAFQQEVVIIILSLPILAYLDLPLLAKTGMLVSLFFILIVETLNTAIEAAIDRIGLEYHELSGLAKDCGSAAVFLSFTIAGLVWTGTLYHYYA